MLEFRNIEHSFQGTSTTVHALKKLDLTVRPGEFITLLGPSGCGKTTLLNMAAGFLKPNDGEVLFQGEPVTAPGRERAVVFQRPALMPWLNVEENIRLALEGVDQETGQQRITAALETVGLRGFDHAMPHELSGGMQQKAAIARALVMDSDLLLMDEPFSSLDEQTRLRLNRELIGIWERERKTILFITHSIQEALLLGTRVILMSVRPGRIIKEWDLSGEKPALDSIPFMTMVQHIRGKMGLCCPPKKTQPQGGLS